MRSVHPHSLLMGRERVGGVRKETGVIGFRGGG